MTLSTHVLDTSRGCPAAGVTVTAERLDGEDWVRVARQVTDADGRVPELAVGEWTPGLWRLVFDTGAYLGPEAFLPRVTVEFRATSSAHHHIPLLLSPFGFSTYRGS